MQSDDAIPDVVIKRLTIYARALYQLHASGAATVSSSELAAATGSTAAQIRRDFSYFGGFGTQGKGYEVGRLLEEVKRILNLNEQWGMVLIGAGSLGGAVARYNRFAENGFVICRIYDRNPERIGNRLDGVTIEDVATLRETVSREQILIAILTVPASAAQWAANLAISAGVKAFLNYAPASILAPPDVRVHDIDPVAALQSLTYYLSPGRSDEVEPSSRTTA